MNSNFWNKKRVLVTGHTGFKGSWLSLWLQELGAEVAGFSNNIPTEPSMFKIAHVENEMNSVFGDIRDISKIQNVINEFKPEIIFHLAAQSLVQESYNNTIETFSTNILGTVNLMEAIRASQSVQEVINVTSDKCYEENELDRGFVETDPMGGHDPYSCSKGCSELITSSYRKSFFNKNKNSNVMVSSVRAGNVIGGGDWAKDRLIPDIIKGILKNNPIMIRNPNYVRHWQHVLDPLYGYLSLAEKMWSHDEKFADSWNFGPKENNAKSVEWILEKFNEYWKGGIKWKIDQRKFNHENKFLKLDSSKSKLMIDWESKIELDNAIKMIVDWYEKLKNCEDMREVTIKQIQEYSRIQ